MNPTNPMNSPKKKMNLPLALAAVCIALPAPHLFAQMSGTSHPEDLDDTAPAVSVPVDGTHYVKPSAGTPAANVTVTSPAPVLQQRNPAADSSQTVYTDTYVPYRPAHLQQTASLRSTDPTLNVTDDINSGVVTSVPIGPNEMPVGTIMTANLLQPISTRTTLSGTRFSASLTNDITHNGVVLLPAGSIVYGRITQIRGGMRLSGPAEIRMQPESVSLPDGTTYKINAEVTDLDHFQDSHVNSEGAIIANAHPGMTAAAVGLTTTSAVVAGAVIGGGVGAVVGLGVGAGVATVWWLKRDRQQELPTGTEIVFTLNDPLHVNPAMH